MNERVDRLETQVSELQLLLNQINKRGSHERHTPNRSSSGSGSYVVRSGDSFWTIARRLNVSVSALEQANPSINPRRLAIGKSIKVPGGTRTSSASSPSSRTANTNTKMGSYRVKQGDILGRISENHGIRLHELMSANPGLDPRRLRVGKILNIPGQASYSAPASAPKPRQVEQVKATPPTQQVYQGVEARRNPYLSNPSSSTRNLSRHYYDVKPPEPRLVPVSRDSRLAEIARLHRTTVAQINKLNDVDLSPEQMIRSGSQLYVPGR